MDTGWHSLISRPPSKAAPCYRCTGTMHFLPRRPPFFQRFILFSVISSSLRPSSFFLSFSPSLSSLIPLITAPFVPGWMQPCTAASTTMERATQNVINIEIERSRRGSSTRPAINPPSPPPPPPSRIWFKLMVFRLIFIATLRRRRVSLFIHSLNVIPASILNPSYRNIKIEILKFQRWRQIF